MNFQSIKKGICEFLSYPNEVVSICGGGELRWGVDMIWSLMRYGARPIDYVRFEYYRKNSFERGKYLTFFKYMKLMKKLYAEGAKHISADKAQEYKKFSKYLQRRWMYADENTSRQEIQKFIDDNSQVIAKPNNGEQGKGVTLIKAGDPIDNLMSDLKTSDFVIEGIVKNCEELNNLNPSSLNTLRVVTLIDHNGKPHVLGAWLRVGAPGKVVDNWGAGGVGYNVDIETGIIDRVGKDKLNRPYIFHPGSNVKMVGFKIPRFNEIKSLVKRMSLDAKEARYVGWDIAITPDGIDLVEMNCPPGHDMMQSLGGGILPKIKELW